MALDFLTTEEVALIRGDVADLVADPQLSGSVIYQAFVGRGTFDPNSQKIVQNFAGTWINAYSRRITETEIDTSDGRYQLGDYMYYVTVAEIILPKKDDRLIDGANTQYVFEFTTDSIKVFHALVARNL